MENIDRKELYTSLPARIKYLHSFLDFTAGLHPRVSWFGWY
jgi:hypothetical protein